MPLSLPLRIQSAHSRKEGQSGEMGDCIPESRLDSATYDSNFVEVDQIYATVQQLANSTIR